MLPLFFLARANPSAPSLPFSRRTPQATVLLSGARLLSSGWVSGAKALNCALAGKQPFGHALRAHQGTPLAQFRCNLTTFRINTYRMPASVDFKPLTRTLSPLDATLTKNQGRGGIRYPPPTTHLGIPVSSRLRVSSTPQKRQAKSKKAHQSDRRALLAKNVVQPLEDDLRNELHIKSFAGSNARSAEEVARGVIHQTKAIVILV